MVKEKEIDNRDDPNTADDYIPTPKDAIADLLYSYDQGKHHNYDKKEKEEKKGAQKQWWSFIKGERWKKIKELWTENFTTYKVILSTEFLQKNYKLNIMSLSRSTIFVACKRFKEDRIFWKKIWSRKKN